MKVKILRDIFTEMGCLASGQVADLGEDSARLLVRKGKAIYVTDDNTDIDSPKDGGSDGVRKHSGRKKSSKGRK